MVLDGVMLVPRESETPELPQEWLHGSVRRAICRKRKGPFQKCNETEPRSLLRELIRHLLGAGLSAAALSPVNARLQVFLQPSIFTTRKALSNVEGMTRAHHWGVKIDPDYYQECSGRITERLGNGGLAANVAFTDLRAVFDHFPQSPDVFLDSFHFGDRGNLAIAQAMVKAIPATL